MALRFYDSQRWKNLRAYQLNKRPLCESCDKKHLTTEATQVDHITPIVDGGSLTSLDNLQSLCAKCHSRKTREENQPGKAIVETKGFADKVVKKEIVTKKGKGKKAKKTPEDLENENDPNDRD